MHVHVFMIQVRALVHEKVVNVFQKYNTFFPPSFTETCHVFEISSKLKHNQKHNEYFNFRTLSNFYIQHKRIYKVEDINNNAKQFCEEEWKKTAASIYSKLIETYPDRLKDPSIINWLMQTSILYFIFLSNLDLFVDICFYFDNKKVLFLLIRVQKIGVNTFYWHFVCFVCTSSPLWFDAANELKIDHLHNILHLFTCRLSTYSYITMMGNTFK